MGFQKAERSKAWVKVALTGPSGSGKSLSALLFAAGVVQVTGGKIAALDSENGSLSLYAGDKRFEVPAFDVDQVHPPFEIAKLKAAVDLAVKDGYSVLVTDSLSHYWAGEGGLLAKKDSLDRAGKGNSYTNWSSVSKEQEEMISKILQSPIHLVATIRSKQDYVQGEKDGRKTVTKVGMAPVQRDGLEYEFTTVLDISMSHEAQASKDRTGVFDGQIFKITPEIGKRYAQWILSGAELKEQPAPVSAPVPAGAAAQAPEAAPTRASQVDPLLTAAYYKREVGRIESAATVQKLAFILTDIMAAYGVGKLTEDQLVDLKERYQAKDAELKGVR